MAPPMSVRFSGVVASPVGPAGLRTRGDVAAASTNIHLGVMTATPKDPLLGFTRCTFIRQLLCARLSDDDGRWRPCRSTARAVAINVRNSPHDTSSVSVATNSAIDAEFSTGAAFTLDATSGSGSVKTENLVVRGDTDKRRVAGSIDGGGTAVSLTSRSGSIKLTSAGPRRP